VNKIEVVPGKQFCPARFATIKDLSAHEDFEVLVIGEDSDSVFGAFTIVAPMAESEDDSKHFTIVNIVIAFGGI
jgi:hypothetical protein